MKKRLLLAITLSGLLPKGFSQSNGTFEQDYYSGPARPFSWVAVAGYNMASNLYTETRINYEAPHSVSLYLGKTFRKKDIISYSVTPLAGFVAGNFNGGSAGANLTVDYKKLSFSSQAQYTFSIANRAKNFTYSWSDMAYQLKGWLAAGLSLQQTGGRFEKGFLVKVIYKNLSMPLYFFDPAARERYFVVGLNLDWDH